MSPSPYAFTLHLKRASQVEGTTKALKDFFPMHITDQRLLIFVAKFPHLAKRKKEKKKKGTTKPPK
jgi:hypothetical protein